MSMEQYEYDERGLCLRDGICVDFDLRKMYKYYESIYGPTESTAIVFPEDVKGVRIMGNGTNCPFAIMDIVEVYDTIQSFDGDSFCLYAGIKEFRVKDHITGEYILKKKFGSNGDKMLEDYASWYNFCDNIKENIEKAKKKNTSPTKKTSPVKTASVQKLPDANKEASDIPDPLKDILEKKYDADSLPENIAKLKIDKVHSKSGSTEYVAEAVKFVLAEYFKVWLRVSTIQHGDLGDTRILKNDLNEISDAPEADEIISMLNQDDFINYLKSRIEGNFYRLVLIPYVKFAKDDDIVELNKMIAVKKKGKAKEQIWAQNLSHAIAGRLNKSSSAVLSGKSADSKSLDELKTELFKSYYSGKEIDGKDWLSNYVSKPDLEIFAESIVWTDIHDKTFILKDGEIINASGTAYKPYGNIRVAHVAEMDIDDINQWIAYLESNKIKQPFLQIAEKKVDLSNIKRLSDSLEGCSITDKQRNLLRKNMKALFIDYAVDDAKKEFDYSQYKYVFSNENTMHLGGCVDIDYVSDSEKKTLDFKTVHIVNRNSRVLNKVINELAELTGQHIDIVSSSNTPEIEAVPGTKAAFKKAKGATEIDKKIDVKNIFNDENSAQADIITIENTSTEKKINSDNKPGTKDNAENIAEEKAMKMSTAKVSKKSVAVEKGQKPIAGSPFDYTPVRQGIIPQCEEIPVTSLKVTKDTIKGFKPNKEVRNVKFPEGRTSIYRRAFYCCNLENVILPNGINRIEFWAFAENKNLKNIVFPESLTKIDSSAFCNCSELQEIILPKGLKTIDSSAFANCSKLKVVFIPPTVKKIWIDAFADCYSLIDIYLPKSVTEFHDTCLLTGNRDLIVHVEKNSKAEKICKEYHIPYDNQEPADYKPREQRTAYETSKPEDFVIEGSVLVRYLGKAHHIIVPDGVSEINPDVFSHDPIVETIDIPDSVEMIWDRNFDYCRNLKSIKYPNHQKEFAGAHFIPLIESIVVPYGAESISYFDFEGCNNLKDVYVPETVTEWKSNPDNSQNIIFHVCKGGNAERQAKELEVNYDNNVGNVWGSDTVALCSTEQSSESVEISDIIQNTSVDIQNTLKESEEIKMIDPADTTSGEDPDTKNLDNSVPDKNICPLCGKNGIVENTGLIAKLSGKTKKCKYCGTTFK